VGTALAARHGLEIDKIKRVENLVMPITYAIARRLGPLGRRWAWNSQFRRGAPFAVSRSPLTIKLVERLARAGVIVELACGDGILSRSIRSSAYSAYRGYDISDVAIERARQLANSKCTFAVCDMCDWRGDQEVSLIVIEEALYYIIHAQQRALLRLCKASLNPEGRILVIVHSEKRHAATLKTCRETLTIDEQIRDGERVHLVLRP
jgi:trans-aconitate methyltransferase